MIYLHRKLFELYELQRVAVVEIHRYKMLRFVLAIVVLIYNEIHCVHGIREQLVSEVANVVCVAQRANVANEFFFDFSLDLILIFPTTKIPIFADEGTTKTFLCARPLVGQFVAIQLVGVEGSLSLCEVEVFSNDGK